MEYTKEEIKEIEKQLNADALMMLLMFTLPALLILTLGFILGYIIAR